MRYVRSFLRFWWNFIVGDDPGVAGALAVVLALTWGLVRDDIAAWWLLPLGVAIILTGSVLRGTKLDD